MKRAQCQSLLEFWGVETDVVSILEADDLNEEIGAGVYLNTTCLTELNAFVPMRVAEPCRPSWLSENEEVTLFVSHVSASPVEGEALVSFQIGDKDYPAVVVSETSFAANERRRRIAFNFDIERTINPIILEDYAPSKPPFAALLPFNCARLVPRKLRPAVKRAQAAFGSRLAFQKAPKSAGGSSQDFPCWPIDKSVATLRYLFLRAIELASGSSVEVAPFWPNGKSFAFALTHDVESKAGLKLVDEIARMEERRSFVSTWNIVGSLWPTSGDVANRLVGAGHEIGLHGARHDARFPFRPKAKMIEALDGCSDFIERFNIVGFRSPSLLRSPEMFQVLAERFEYDSSVPDTAKLSPYPRVNGCCTIFPYTIGDLLELPITLPLDSSLIFLGYDSDNRYQIWKDKIEWIESVGGLAMLCTHIESCFLLRDEKMLSVYERLLDWLSSRDNVWIASMSDIARWWRRRMGK